ncbi:MAG: hypothetical protein KAI67_06355 [Candidatus Pacebacteria bacterium]|nr:hypothetical protein [Candidatus Paceibacterota bacterium]
MKKSEQLSENKRSDQKSVNIKLLPADFWIYSNPIILMMNFKGGKRAEAGQWSLEIQKMLRGIVESVIGLENLMNQLASNKKIYLENQEILISDEKKYWLMIYLVDNAILRIYACLDKIAQMCRCYFEHKENGGALEAIRKCGCTETMNEDNCNFGSLITYLNSGKNKNQRKLEIVETLNKINNNKSISILRAYRNTFSHKKHAIDQTAGIDPKVCSEYKPDGTVETQFSFGEQLPSLNWFRVELVNANNAIIKGLAIIQNIIFPRDFNITISKKSK